MIYKFFLLPLYILLANGQCQPASPAAQKQADSQDVAEVMVGAARLPAYLPLLNDGRRIACVVNQTSRVNGIHLIDTLLAAGIDIVKIFAPEHGFRGMADDGEKIDNQIDAKTGLPIISLYGKYKKPQAADLATVDMVVFDIQDVGVRFYTFISTLHLVMEACAENDIPLLVLDRPNPNGHYIDGPVLEQAFTSFVGMHPVPVVHGMTIAEYARMINGEAWLANGIKCKLQWIPCANYSHTTRYELPIPPSPNLPNMRAVYLYPSLAFFEGTVVSEGRGTDYPFQVYGHPALSTGSYTFTPAPGPGAKHPKLEGQQCFGQTFAGWPPDSIRAWKQLELDYLIRAFKALDSQSIDFFLPNLYFDKLAGTDSLRKQILSGKTEEEIRAHWQEGLNQFRSLRAAYLLYEDF